MSSRIEKLSIVYISNLDLLEGYAVVGRVDGEVATVRHEDGGIYPISVSYLSRVEAYEKVKDFVPNGIYSDEENRIMGTRRKEFRKLLFTIHEFLRQALALKTHNLE